MCLYAQKGFNVTASATASEPAECLAAVDHMADGHLCYEATLIAL